MTPADALEYLVSTFVEGLYHDDPTCPEDDTCQCANVTRASDAVKLLRFVVATNRLHLTPDHLRGLFDAVWKEGHSRANVPGWLSEEHDRRSYIDGVMRGLSG